jgi:UDP-N-acetylmuramoylalanine--D-glutamate ligase
VVDDNQYLDGKRVVILGLARQGTALARFLVQAGAQVVVSDLRNKEELVDSLAELADLPISYELGRHPQSLLEEADLMCLSGGVPLDLPVVTAAVSRSIPLSNDAQLFLERCPAPVVGITGSAGKTTTTALVGDMCRQAGFTTWVGGNIGNPLISDLGQIRSSDRVIMELSSFQLEIMTHSPHIAVVLNITPNHLDRHKTMESYVSAKQRIVSHQGPDDYAVLGFDDNNARALAAKTEAQPVFYSGKTELDEGAFRAGDRLILRLGGREDVVCRTDEIGLRGDHNVLNVLAACVIGAIAEVPLSAMHESIRSFTGVDHRLELVGSVGGVQYYDDSIATAPERVVAALRSFDEPIVLLAGGQDKDLPWEGFATETIGRVTHLITFGEAGDMIARIVDKKQAEEPTPQLKSIVQVVTLEDAVKAAAALAQPGDVVLLSPGGTSFDAYRDFAERGDHFKKLIRNLGEQ